MEKEIKKKIAQEIDSILEVLKSSITKGGNFLAKETPVVIGEILKWEFFITLSGWIISFITFIIGIIGLIISIPRIDWMDAVGPFTPYWLLLFFSLTFSALGMLAGICNLDWVKIKIAPRLFLMEYFKRFLKDS